MRDNEFWCARCGQLYEVVVGTVLEAQREHQEGHDEEPETFEDEEA